jgi:acyl carrier protein
MTIQERAIAAISKGCSRKAREISIDTQFDQLDVDSVDRLQILFELEEEFDIVIPDKVARRATSVREVVEKLTEVLAAGSVSANE